MKKREIAVVIIFIAIVVMFVIASVNGAVGKRAEPVSKAEIEVRLAQTAAAPKAEVKLTALAETASEDAQPAFAAEAEEVISEEENEPETAENASETEETIDEPEYIAETDAYIESFSPEAEDSCFGEDQQHGDEHDLIYLGTFTITAYCNCSSCCGVYAGGATASGAYPTEGWTCACNAFPLGTIVYIDGIGERCIEDRGDSIMDESWIDVYFSNHDEAQAFGLRYLDVYLRR